MAQAPPTQRWGTPSLQRRAFSLQVQAPVALTQMGVSPKQAAWFVHLPLVQRCGVAPWQRTALAVQAQAPPAQTGVSPEQADWFTQLPLTQRCGVVPSHCTASSLQAQRPVAARHTGVAPLQAVSFCQAPAALHVCGESVSRQRRPLPSVGSQATQRPPTHCGVAPAHAGCAVQAPVALHCWGTSPLHWSAPALQRPQVAVSLRQAGVSPEQAGLRSQAAPLALHSSGTVPVQRLAPGWQTTQPPSKHTGVAVSQVRSGSHWPVALQRSVLDGSRQRRSSGSHAAQAPS